MTIFINKGVITNNAANYEIIEEEPFKWLAEYKAQDFTQELETTQDYLSAKKKIKLEDAQYFISGTIQKNEQGEYLNRNDDNLKSRNLLAIDYDFESEVSHEQFIDTITSDLNQFNYIIYPTISANKETPRYRVIIELSRSVNKEEYIYILKDFKRSTRLEYDLKSETWSQWQGLPIKTPQNKGLKRIIQSNKEPLYIPKNILSKTEKEKPQLDLSKDKYSRVEAKYVIEEQLQNYLNTYHSDKYNHRLKAYHCLTPTHEDNTPSMIYHAKDKPHLHCYGCNSNLDIFNLIGLDYGLNSFKEQFNKAIELFNIKLDDYELNLENIESIKTTENEDKSLKISSHTTIDNLEPTVKYSLTQEEKLELYRNTKAKNHIETFKQSLLDKQNHEAINTGFDLLDRVLDGGIYNQLVSIGAISSLGKTTLMLQIADNIAKQGHDVLLFSIEMTRHEVMAKSLSRITYELSKKDGKITEDVIDGKQFYNARTVKQITDLKRYNGYTDLYGVKHKPYTPYQLELIERAYKEYEQYSGHLYIQQGLSIGADTIEEAITNHIKATKRKPIVIIDYLQIVAPHDERFSDKMNTDYVIKLLKQIVMKKELPIIAISSFNRDSYHNDVSMKAFKESGAIEYTSDIVLGLQFSRQREISKQNATKKNNEPRVVVNHDEEKRRSPRHVEMKVLKNRNGATGDSIDFYYNQFFNYFENTETDLSVIPLSENRPYKFKGNLANQIGTTKNVKKF